MPTHLSTYDVTRVLQENAAGKPAHWDRSCVQVSYKDMLRWYLDIMDDNRPVELDA
jgi:hypothetical protein